MARFAAFGNIVFEVSYFKVLTFDDFSRKTKANFAEHKILNRKSKLEFTGIEPQEISMTILLDNNFSVDVEGELKKLRQMCEAGEVNFLIIGAESLGQFVIEEVSEKVLHWSGVGIPLVVECQIKFKEYV